MKMMKHAKRPTLKGIMTVAVMMAFVLIAGCSKEEAYRQIKVYEIDGSATVTREGTGEVEPYVNMMLQNKDKAETATASYVQLQLDGDKYVLMEPSTKIELEATGDSVDSKTKISLTQGAIVNKIEKALSEDSTYEVTTPNSTMAVRGTTFRVEVDYDENGESYTALEVCEGKVECRLIAPDGTVSKEPVLVEAGERVKIRGTSEISEYLGDKEEFDYDAFKEKVLWFIGFVEEETETETEMETEAVIETETETQETESEEPEPVVPEPKVEPESEEDASADEDSGSTDSGDSGSTDTGTSTPTTPAKYTVTFKDSAGNVFATQTVTSGGTATEPILSPEAAGAWNFDFSTAITADTEISWTPN